MDAEEGEFLGGEGENPFSRCKAYNVCRHPGVTLPVDAIQGQKCLCCLMGSNSIAFSTGTCL